MPLPTLPLNESSFRAIRTAHMLYVDKTDLIAQLINLKV